MFYAAHPVSGNRKEDNKMASSRPEPPQDLPPSSRLEEILDENLRIQELTNSDDEYEDIAPLTKEEEANMSYLESVKIPIVDELKTDSSEVQDEAFEAVMPFLEGNPNNFPLNIFGLPQLQRQKHVTYLKKALGDYPAPFALMDASRPWLVYWSLQGLSALGYDFSELRERCVGHVAAIGTSSTVFRFLDFSV